MVAEPITSPTNPRVKAFAALKKARDRRETGLFLIEGRREVDRALTAGVEIEQILLCPSLLGPLATPLDFGGETLELGESAFAKVALSQNPAGIIAVARQFDTSLAHIDPGPYPLLLVVERIEKPGNLGAMLRTADAAGVDAVLVADPVSDVFNPNVVRASQGALFSVPLAVTSTAEIIAWLRAREIVVVGGYPEATAELWESDLTAPTAMLVGAEDAGISAVWEGLATPVRIPMAGIGDSLNASVSAGILLFEAFRQRRR